VLDIRKPIARLGHNVIDGVWRAGTMARFFGLVLPPWGPDWPAAYSFLVGLHDASTYLLLALTIGHVAMALKHALIERDGIFARIAP
jgi:cytochrome b561